MNDKRRTVQFVFRFIVPLTMIIAVLTGCYESSVSKYSSSKIVYSFEEPRDYCQRSMSDTGIEMQCVEGDIYVNFDVVTHASSSTDLINQKYHMNNQYTWEELEGKYAQIAVAIRNEDVPDPPPPSYVAIWQTSGSFLVVAEGFPSIGMEKDFDEIFKKLIASIEVSSNK